MRAFIKLISGRNHSHREFQFEDKKDLEQYLKELHWADPKGWIVFTIEGEEIDT